MVIFRIYLKALLYFPATVLHELAHYFGAVMVGRVLSFSVIPRIVGDRIVLGSVVASPRLKSGYMLIAAAPLIWWVVLYQMLSMMNLVDIEDEVQYLNIAINYSGINLKNIWVLYAGWQLLKAGRLSVTDLKVFFHGLFSFSAVVAVIVLIMLTVFMIHTSAAINIEKLKPTTKDLERVKKYEYLGRQKKAFTKELDGRASVPARTGRSGTAKEGYLFYLFSKSVPDTTVDSVFEQARKLENTHFYGVVRGIDKDRDILKKIQTMKAFEGTTIKIHPLIFRAVGADKVPAFVYALCPEPAMFRAAECEYRMIVYGDISLRGALQLMIERDAYVKLAEDYRRLIDVSSN
jgi:type-F conjugative transfer system pilin assembly protein TrbC